MKSSRREKASNRRKKEGIQTDGWLQTNLEIKFVFMPSYYNWKKWQLQSKAPLGLVISIVGGGLLLVMIYLLESQHFVISNIGLIHLLIQKRNLSRYFCINLTQQPLWMCWTQKKVCYERFKNGIKTGDICLALEMFCNGEMQCLIKSMKMGDFTNHFLFLRSRR